MGKKLTDMTLEELWELFPIILTEHNDCWNRYYAEEAAELIKILPKESIISHIGSTAIKGIWAKPTVDILVEVSESAKLTDVATILQNNGWTKMSESEKRASFNKGYTENGFAEKVYHLHLRYIGDNDEIFFRDYLNTHPEIAKEYEKLKLDLWKRFEHDRDGYTAAKGEFVAKYTALAKQNENERTHMTGILYFSSTGNSLYISQQIKEKIGGQIIYIPTYEGDGSEFDKLVVVTPIYSFGIPTYVYDLLPRLNRKTEIVVVLNYGGMIGGADYFVYSYALRNGLNVKSLYAVKMPENFTLDFTVPKFYLKLTLKNVDKKLNEVISSIANGETVVPRTKRTKEETYLKNKENWHVIGERFSTTNECVKCGKCVSVCPAKNISLEDGKIVFSNSCVACLGCYHRCPKKAIVYRNKKKKDRYVNPNVDEALIGKNID